MKDQKQVDGYNNYVKAKIPKTKPFPSLLWAFLVGGLICCIGQGINDGITAIFPELTKDIVSAYTLVILIFLSTLFTGLGIYDKIGAFAGAGSIIPITGFANSIQSATLAYRKEGFVTGIGANMFKLAGSVIAYGIISSYIFGILRVIIHGI